MKKITLFFVFLLMSAAAFTTAAADYVRGDVTGDGNVNVSDVTTLIQLLITDSPAPPAADCNQDGRLNVSDVTSLIDFVMKGTWPAAPHEWVDLGLPSGTLWATCNVGANSPEEYGDYFAWGETEPKEVYDWTTYKWCNGTHNTMTKYCSNSDYGANGFVDNKKALDPEDDAAYVNWGPSWRMPTMAQLQELVENCTWQLTKLNGVDGQLAKGPNGKTLFFPAASYRYDHWLNEEGINGDYWSREGGFSTSYLAFDLYFEWEENVYWDDFMLRKNGLSVRPVRVSQ